MVRQALGTGLFGVERETRPIYLQLSRWQDQLQQARDDSRAVRHFTIIQRCEASPREMRLRGSDNE
jgi:hypothetical protein